MSFLPIAERELRVAARRPGTYWLRFVCALLVTAVWVLVMTTAVRRQGLYQTNRLVFNFLAVVNLAVGFLAGVLLTSDCLSREKREGTLGLLFLTDLKGFDIVVGKLAGHVVHLLYVLLAVTPVMALPLLVGGIGMAQFVGVAVALLVALLFAVACGILVSVYAQDVRASLGYGLVLALGIAAGLPAVNLMFESFIRRPQEDGLLGLLTLWPSPFYCLIKALFQPGSARFWASAVTIGCVSILFLSIACWVLPRRWEATEGTLTATGWLASLRRRRRYGDGTWREPWRRRMVERQPALWLAGRDRHLSGGVRRTLLTVLPLWWFCWFGSWSGGFGRGDKYFVICIVSALVAHLWLKVVVALEGANRFCEDRRSGAEELLRVSPLTSRERVHGFAQAMGLMYWPSVLVVLALNLFLWSVVVGNAKELHFGRDDRFMFTVLIMGGALLLPIDLRAIVWTTARRAWEGRKHLSAALGGLALTMVPAWAAIIIFMFLMINVIRGSQEMAITFFVCWVCGSGVWSWGVGSRAKKELLRACGRAGEGSRC